MENEGGSPYKFLLLEESHGLINQETFLRDHEKRISVLWVTSEKFNSYEDIVSTFICKPIFAFFSIVCFIKQSMQTRESIAMRMAS